MKDRRERDDEAPLFLIPRIPGTSYIAIVGLGLVLLTAVSALMRSRGPSPAPEPAEIVDETDTLAGQDLASLHLTGSSQALDAVIIALAAEPIGEDMWRFADADGAFIVLREPDGLWLHDLPPATRDEVERMLAQARSDVQVTVSGPGPSSDH